MIKGGSQRRWLISILPYLVAMCCFFVISVFPQAFTVGYSPEKQPTVLLYIFAAILFSSVFLAVNTELSFLGFRKNSLVVVVFSLLFALSMLLLIIGYLFTDIICSFVAYEGIRKLVPYIVFGFANAFLLFSLVVVGALRFFKRKKSIQ